MKRKVLNRLIVCAAAVAMTASQMPAAVVTAEESSPYVVFTDDNGNPIDLGGMEIIERNWWGEPVGSEAQTAYWDWAQKTYNFKYTVQGDLAWEDCTSTLVDYVNAGGDGNNYIFTLHDSNETSEAMVNGKMFNLASLDCLDFSEPKFSRNKVHEKYTFKNGVYAMSTGASEFADGLFINKKILSDAGIDVNEIYNAQANGTWTWDKFKEIMGKVQRDTNGDGVNDIWGFTGNTGSAVGDFVISNGTDFVTSSEDGYVYSVEDAKTIEGLNFARSIMKDYYMPRPDGSSWDYFYEEFKSGTALFCLDGAFAGYSSGALSSCSFPVGFVSIPAGPHGANVSIARNNPLVIPACYDKSKAWKIAFAYMVMNEPLPGDEFYSSSLAYAATGIFDDRAVNETLTLAGHTEHVFASYNTMIPNFDINQNVVWQIYADCDVNAVVSAYSAQGKSVIAATNASGSKATDSIANNSGRWAKSRNASIAKNYSLNEEYVPAGYVDKSGSPMVIPEKNLSWNAYSGNAYWYESGVKQGTYFDPKGVIGFGTNRGREIYDPGTGDWYWLDTCRDGGKAMGKEVWVPYVYQDESGWSEDKIRDIAGESGELSGCVYDAITAGTGKWVRYDENGKMLKGWVTISGTLAELYPDQAGNTYYYDKRTGLMAKGNVTIDGVEHHFDETTGVLDR